MTPELAALIGIGVCALIIGGIAFHAQASDDLSVSQQMGHERTLHGNDLPRWHRRAKRAQLVLSVVAIICLTGVAWAVRIFVLALEPGEDPSGTGAAIGVAGFGFIGTLICAYQIARFGVRRRAITRIQRGE